ncbi:MAG: hypothetical protein ABIA04_11580 [Pseudomonadota bacterium]
MKRLIIIIFIYFLFFSSLSFCQDNCINLFGKNTKNIYIQDVSRVDQIILSSNQGQEKVSPEQIQINEASNLMLERIAQADSKKKAALADTVNRCEVDMYKRPAFDAFYELAEAGEWVVILRSDKSDGGGYTLAEGRDVADNGFRDFYFKPLENLAEELGGIAGSFGQGDEAGIIIVGLDPKIVIDHANAFLHKLSQKQPEKGLHYLGKYSMDYLTINGFRIGIAYGEKPGNKRDQVEFYNNLHELADSRAENGKIHEVSEVNSFDGRNPIEIINEKYIEIIEESFVESARQGRVMSSLLHEHIDARSEFIPRGEDVEAERNRIKDAIAKLGGKGFLIDAQFEFSPEMYRKVWSILFTQNKGLGEAIQGKARIKVFNSIWDHAGGDLAIAASARGLKLSLNSIIGEDNYKYPQDILVDGKNEKDIKEGDIIVWMQDAPDLWAVFIVGKDIDFPMGLNETMKQMDHLFPLGIADILNRRQVVAKARVVGFEIEENSSLKDAYEMFENSFALMQAAHKVGRESTVESPYLYTGSKQELRTLSRYQMIDLTATWFLRFLRDLNSLTEEDFFAKHGQEDRDMAPMFRLLYFLQDKFSMVGYSENENPLLEENLRPPEMQGYSADEARIVIFGRGSIDAMENFRKFGRYSDDPDLSMGDTWQVDQINILKWIDEWLNIAENKDAVIESYFQYRQDAKYENEPTIGFLFSNNITIELATVAAAA